ncbi:hypothetical protein [PinkBerry-associated phage LS06-2018-MD08]|nr:hypothetical protein [PinkBerry-associated phage LS06-2018-MD08]
MEKVKPDIKVEKVPKGYIYQSNDEVGKTDRVFIHPHDNEYIAKIKDELQTLRMAKDRDDLIVEATLNALGVNTKNSLTSMYLLCSVLLNAKILLDSEDYVMVESINGYIKGVAKGDVFKAKYLEQFSDVLNGCYKVVDGEIVLDEDKYNQVVGSL